MGTTKKSYLPRGIHPECVIPGGKPLFQFQVVLEALKGDRKEVEVALLRNFVEGSS